MIRQQFNDNWIFKKYGEESGRRITLPHDAMLEEKRAPENPTGGAGAYFGTGTYIYEKELEVPAEWENKHIELQFEGVYKNSKVYINGLEVGGAAYGYIPYFVNLDGKVNYGATNIIKVVADNSDAPSSRWYTGAGIYRPVWLWVGEKAHVHPEGIHVTTLSYDPAVIRVEVATSEVTDMEIQICDGETVVATANKETELTIPNVKLWSEDTPNLYTCKVALKKDGVVIDEAENQFGIRLVEWSNNGLLINGKNTLLRGGCVHHDNGILGAASFEESEFRRVKILKDAGYNAIRSAHNPIAEATLRACDTYGMYVMDECWDMWYNKKSRYDYANDFMNNYKTDLEALASRDYNHPSVIMYSIGNEVSEPATEKGVALSQELVDSLHKLDGSRAVTAGYNLMIIAASANGKGIYDPENGGQTVDTGNKTNTMSSTMFNLITYIVGSGMSKLSNTKKVDKITTPVMNTLDICGYNYASSRYSKEGKIHPERILVGSETFPQDIAKNWKMVKEYPYLIGDFMWTSWDYLGEVGIGAWAYTEDARGMEKPYPWILADVGAIDILGNPNGELFWAQAAWDLLDNPRIAVQPVNHPNDKLAKGVWRGTNALPSWSWKNCDGNKAVVEVYTNAPIVELFINEKKVGKKKTKDCRAVFKTKYETGQIRALAYNEKGVKVGERVLTSAIGTSHVCVTAEKENIKNGDIVYYDISILGENGIVESNADRKLKVRVEGGELLAFGSANPRTEESYLSGEFTTYYGKAQAIVRVSDAVKLKVNVAE
ncbi:MAG: DUF4982 domain-containing protein [Agathobacter sp.]|nr:DUF4982 domain-containing protein [Agathobacter sp.]